MKIKEKLDPGMIYRLYEGTPDNPGKLFYESHNITSNPLKKSFIRRIRGIPESGDSLDLKYLAVGTKHRTLSSENPTLGLEKFRLTPNMESVNTDETEYTAIFTVMRTDSNTTCAQTTAVTDSNNTTSNVKVASITGFRTGDWTRVDVNGSYEYTESTVDSTNTRLSFSPALSAIL